MTYTYFTTYALLLTFEYYSWGSVFTVVSNKPLHILSCTWCRYL